MGMQKGYYLIELGTQLFVYFLYIEPLMQTEQKEHWMDGCFISQFVN